MKSLVLLLVLSPVLVQASDAFQLNRIQRSLLLYDTKTSLSYDFANQQRSASLLLDWRPVNNAFHFSIGGFYQANLSASDDLSGGHAHTGPRGKTTYLGLGWDVGDQHEPGWRMAWDLGLFYQAGADSELGSGCIPGLQARQCIGQPSSSDDEWSPAFSLGIHYQF